jgi:undecaprenyl-diphosphatase
VILGVLQGLGEFLPISSSAHLVVVPWALGWPEHGLSFDIALHLGTLAAVLCAFARDWWRMGRSLLRGVARRQPFAEPPARLLGLIALATIPGGLAGLLLDDWIESTLRSPGLIAGAMAALGLALLIADRRRGTLETEHLLLGHALLIGLSQALALMPGVSRSGITISAALLLGYRRDEAARFSFLLATPITFGAAALKVPVLLQGAERDLALAGMAAAMLVGWSSIVLLLRFVRMHDYRPFVWYRFAFAALVVATLLAGAS